MGDASRGDLTEEADVVEREAEVGEGRAALEGAGEGAGAGAVEGVTGEVEEDEGGTGLEGAGVVGGGVAGDVHDRADDGREQSARAAGQLVCV